MPAAHAHKSGLSEKGKQHMAHVSESKKALSTKKSGRDLTAPTIQAENEDESGDSEPGLESDSVNCSEILSGEGSESSGDDNLKRFANNSQALARSLAAEQASWTNMPENEHSDDPEIEPPSQAQPFKSQSRTHSQRSSTASSFSSIVLDELDLSDNQSIDFGQAIDVADERNLEFTINHDSGRRYVPTDSIAYRSKHAGQSSYNSKGITSDVQKSMQSRQGAKSSANKKSKRDIHRWEAEEPVWRDNVAVKVKVEDGLGDKSQLLMDIDGTIDLTTADTDDERFDDIEIVWPEKGGILSLNSQKPRMQDVLRAGISKVLIDICFDHAFPESLKQKFVGNALIDCAEALGYKDIKK
ncbi:hypothetical protein AcV5_009429 [Taiwanofungus camphoratus]|nr:hypothetical protein AcV5_009429 [Antrodia cinnamomea]